ncbi:MAG: EAL domain-containing protein [Deltaproteobacteria bacterium]|nr:EAL domain-containing protein [Deltaproteobacteria bacterium]
MQATMVQNNSPAVITEQSHVLIVDDQLSLLHSMQALLRINGYQVTLARSGGEAITKLQDADYQLVLLDLQMPGIDGLEVLEYIQQAELDLEVVVVSGETSFSSVKEAIHLGASDFVRKPYNPEELLTTVSQGLERYRQKRLLVSSEHTLTESERIHRFIVNNSPDFIYMLNTQGVFTYVNDMVEKLLGYKRDELLGKHFSSIIHAHNADEIHKFFSEQRAGERATQSAEVRLLVNQANDRVQSLDNYELVVELNAVGMYEEDQTGEKIFTGTLGSARDVTERKRTQDRINHQAYHDLLTRLPNRALFNDRMSQAFAHARRTGENFALMFMDLDRFKLINDTLGHVMGDRVLQFVSERILDCLRAEDTLCRFGGDEFSLLLPNISTKESVASVAEKILKAVRQPFHVNNHELYLSMSLGVAMFPIDGETRETLLQSADIAMYQVKDNGKDGYCFYSDTMNCSSNFISVERDMYYALEKQQFQVFFQPKVNPENHMIVGMEALLRWQHPQRGLLYPDEFLAAAEESKLIVSIGEWALRSICQEIVRWQQQGLPKIKVSVNISPAQLEQDDFVERFIHTVHEFKLAADIFEIEISEQSLLRGPQNLAKKIHSLRDYGVSIAIDDFGRGASSLGYLQYIPVNTLKIDRSFVRDIDENTQQARIVDGIAMMAKGLNLNLVAEGVENLLQLDYVRNLGCHEVQGYLYGAAVSAQAAMAMMESRPSNGPHFILPH